MQSLKRKNVVFILLVFSVLLHACLFGQMKDPVPTKAFIPFPTNALSCSIRLFKPWGKVEVSMVNTSSVRQVFSAPRMITGVDLQSEKNIEVNTINIECRWGGNRTVSAMYGTFEKTIIGNTNMSLPPHGTSKVVIDLKDFYFGMRDNLVPFNECFKEGDSNVCIQASLVTINQTKHTAISMSNEENIKGDYIH